MKPLLSFIITYHNEPEAYLQACLESIQALPLAKDEAEIIVVDDGSRNNVQCSSLQSGAGGTMFNVQWIRQEESGLSVARNTGIAQAQGLYIQFVDADDSLVPTAYETVLRQLRNGKADVVMFQMTKKAPRKQSVKKNVQCSSLQSGAGGTMFNVQCLFEHHNLRSSACGYAFRRDILGDLRFCPGLLHEDELFTPQLFLKAETLVELDAKAYFYRQHSSTITHSDTLEQVQKRLDDIHFILRELKSLDNPLLERRIHQLTVDYLQKTWTLTHSQKVLRSRMKDLRKEGFLPLPLRRYSSRYLLIALLAKPSKLFY